jgi:hypothetical protein
MAEAKFDETKDLKDDKDPIEASGLAVDKKYLFKIPIHYLEYILKDEDGNPCAFYKYEITFPDNKRAPIKGHLDEEGRLYVKPAPKGEYVITFYDDAGKKVSAVDHKAAAGGNWKGPPPARGGKAPAGQGWR